MAGLDPAIHDFPYHNTKSVDAWDKPGHDGGWESQNPTSTATPITISTMPTISRGAIGCLKE